MPKREAGRAPLRRPRPRPKWSRAVPVTGSWMGLLRGDEPKEIVDLHAQLEAGVLEAWIDDRGEVTLVSNPRVIAACLRELDAAGLLRAGESGSGLPREASLTFQPGANAVGPSRELTTRIRRGGRAPLVSDPSTMEST